MSIPATPISAQTAEPATTTPACPLALTNRWARCSTSSSQSKRPVSAEIVDIDEDSCEEVVLRSATMYAVLSPACGARLVYLFALIPRGAILIIGNPTDDWNLQQELNAYMQSPRIIQEAWPIGDLSVMPIVSQR